MAQKTALDALSVGLPCRDADKAARDVINSAGYEGCFGHSLGHGVGRNVHEEPRLSAKSDEILKVGNIVTVEPGIYRGGEITASVKNNQKQPKCLKNG